MSASDRLLLALAAIVRHLFASSAYLASYGATVLGQNADGTLELRLDTAKVKVPGGVRILGLPGVSVKVAKGARCLVSFVDGDPQEPHAELFDPTSLVEITITATTRITANAPLVELAGGGMPLARQGDVVQVVLPFTPQPAAGPPVPFPIAGQVLSGSTASSSS